MAQNQSDFTVGWQVSFLSSENSNASGENVTAALKGEKKKKKKHSNTSNLKKIVLAGPIQTYLEFCLSKIRDSACLEDPGENSHSMPAGLDWGRNGLESICQSKKGTIEVRRPMIGNNP